MPLEPGDLPPLAGNPLLDSWRQAVGVGRDDPMRMLLARRYAYGIPTDEALDAIAALSPAGVVELGAGTGYWARLLHERGVDVVAYDRWPPPSGENRYVRTDTMWHSVQPGDEHMVDRHPDRTLLLVWPTWNEAWPGEAVARHHRSGGEALVFVGEGPGGRTGDSVLHARLGDYGTCLACSLGVLDAPCVCGVDALWQLVRRVPLPQWVNANDACHIYERRAGANAPTRSGLVSALRRRTVRRR